MQIAFVDETDVHLAAEKCLLYAVYVCAEPDVASQALTAIRAKYAIPAEQEIKWTIDTGDRDRNAKIKEDLLCTTHGPGDQFLVSVTRARDKISAFHRSLQQVHDHFRSIGVNHYGVVYDHDTTPNRRAAEVFMGNLSTPPFCTLFADASSHLTAGICAADAFAGAYAYMIHKQDVEQQPQIDTGHHGMPLRLDAFFWEIFRRRIPGEVRWNPSHHPDEDIARVETAYRHTLGRGLVLDPSLTPAQRARFDTLVDLFLGCTL
jgi:hypothetical protein